MIRVGPSPPRDGAHDTTGIAYRFVQQEALPVLDPTRTVKQALFPPRLNRVYNHLMYKYRRVVGPAYLLGIVLRVLSLHAPAPIGRRLCFASPLFQFPATLLVCVSFRVEFLRYLARCYEFWYFLFVNGIWLISFAVTLGDERIVLLPFMWIEFQNVTVIDAYFRELKSVVLAAWLGIIQLLLMMVAIAFDFIDERSDFELVATSYRTLTTRDVLLNACGTIAILLTRLAYRRRAALRHRRKSLGRIIRVISLRCKVALDDSPRRVRMGLDKAPVDQLARRPDLLTFRLSASPSIRFRPPQAMQTPWGRWIRFRIALLASASVVSAAWTFYARPGESSPANERAAILPLLAMIFFVGEFAPYYSTHVLLGLASSFDTVFLSIQITAAHVCVCDLFGWRWSPCSSVMCSWLWWHWILALDALPPVSRQHIGIRLRWLTVLLVLSLVAQWLLIIELVTWNHWDLQDRVLFRVPLHVRHAEFHVVPFLFSRLLTILIWSLRLLYRLGTSLTDNELIMLFGGVEYTALATVQGVGPR